MFPDQPIVCTNELMRLKS